MKLNPSQTNLFIILGSVVLTVVSVLIFTGELNRPKDSSAYAAPSVGLLETNDNKILIHAKSNEEGAEEQFIFCVNKEKNPETCVWENYDEFELDAEGDYYIYVKSLASGKVSAPKLKTYEIIDRSNVRM